MSIFYPLKTVDVRQYKQKNMISLINCNINKEINISIYNNSSKRYFAKAIKLRQLRYCI